MQWHLPTSSSHLSCAPLIRQPVRHLKFECNVLHSNVDFYFKFDEYSKLIFFDSPNTHTLHSSKGPGVCAVSHAQLWYAAHYGLCNTSVSYVSKPSRLRISLGWAPAYQIAPVLHAMFVHMLHKTLVNSCLGHISASTYNMPHWFP